MGRGPRTDRRDHPRRVPDVRGGWLIDRSETLASRPPARGCRHARSLGMTTAAGFTITNAPVAGDLLGHFLDGTGTAVRYGPRSPIAREARASTAFRELNRRVQAAVLSQLAAGTRHVRLPSSDLT